MGDVRSHREELAWAAGFFDGEGHTGRRGIRGVPAMSIAQIDRRVLDRFGNAVGLGKVYGPYEKRDGRGADYWQWWSGSFADVQRIVALLWDFLSEVKREQASAAIEGYMNAPAKRKTGPKPRVAA